ncbi:protein kinase domain-containing protein [Stieleria varia]|uniref:Serine/threonine-protein kinase PknL n=1 Tax=Stieleria varia TaxID=2528005 RepID=A0A5C5ZXQ7_9BACT|nr:serine/threonine-protein kinase [Stieleria varia]TWT92434.1 Serine/threonine-protein kinase PknL [Stieleria varia]
MIDKRYTITTDASSEVEELLARFERDRSQDVVDLSDYLLPDDDPAHSAVVTELCRIDMERAFEEGKNSQASIYTESFPEVFCDETHRTQLVFEEYRLRRRAGEDIDPMEIAGRYGIDGSRWPKLKLGSGESGRAMSTTRRFRKEDLAVQSVKYPRTGDIFAGYPLGERLGEGAFSRVFLARQPDLASRPVVLKVTPMATDESDRLARLQHTHIIPVYSVHREGDLSCICMPFLGATTLADLSQLSERWASLDGPAIELVSTIVDRRRSTISMVQGNPSPASAVDESGEPDETETSHEGVGLEQYAKLGYVDALLRIVTGAAEGLAHAHQRGIIHRDLKPANILVGDDGNALLLDFNLATASYEPKTKIVGGTLPYMSPQQLAALENGHPPDARDDVFSMGVILYELLTGHLPFDCPRAGEEFELSRVIADRRRSPREVHSRNKHVSVGLSDIISRCVAPDREDRYGDATELLEDLNCHRQNLPLLHAPNRSIRERLTKWSARHPSITSASFAGSLAALLLVACVFLIYQRGQKIARFDAKFQWQDFQNEATVAITALSSPGRESELLLDGVGHARQLVNHWIDPATLDWNSEALANHLEHESRVQLSQQVSRLAYLMADAETDIGIRSGAKSRVSHRESALKWNRVAAAFDSRMSHMLNEQDLRIRQLFEGGPSDLSITEIKPNSSDLRLLAASRSTDAATLRELANAQLSNEPTNVALWFYRAIANARLGDWNSAVASMDACNSLQPRSLTILFNRGLFHLSAGDARAAIGDFTECVAIKPDMLTARFNRAVAAEQMGQYQLALDDLNAVLESDRATTRMVLMRRRIHQTLGNDVAAQADLLTAMSIPPRDANDWVARGVARLDKEPKRAIEDFLSALKIDPSHFDALQNVAHVYAERLNEPRQALPYLDRLVSAWPSKASPVSSRGIIHARLAALDSAIADAKAAEALEPGPREQLQIAGIYAISQAGINNTENVLPRDEANTLAIRWLGRALRNDPSLAKIASVDVDLASLRRETVFRRLVGSAMTLQSSDKEQVRDPR